MAPPTSSPTAVLYQNPTKSITLLDIPRSISLAQGTLDHPCTHEIYSSPALQTPYQSIEPKSEKAKANVIRMKPIFNVDQEFPESLLRAALEVIAGNHGGDWCLERKISPFLVEKQSRKRKSDTDVSPLLSTVAANSDYGTRQKSPTSILTRGDESRIWSPKFQDPVILSACINPPGTDSCPNMTQITDRLVHNPCPYPLSLQQVASSHGSLDVYIIPPHAKFFLSKIDQTTALAMSMATLNMYPEPSATAGAGQFDFTLLDPPWDNRSVKRSAQYTTMRELGPMEVLHSMLGQHIALGGLVACWITNKATVRDAALKAFEAWDVHITEEWAWLKTTVLGKPVTDITGLWRKPYEILLIGRKTDDRFKKLVANVHRRTVVAVPDIHSRKPNIKALIEPMVPPQYRALEVFARNPTASWWAWGDEVLKYASENHWSKRADVSDA